MKKKIIVIGSGFAGLSAAAYLAQDGHQVILLEKNESSGGRGRIWEKEGFTFDMGPSWYWMPEVFETFFSDFNFKCSDFYQLTRLDPGYRIYFTENRSIDVPANPEELKKKFEAIEAGSGVKLEAFLKDAEYKYKTAMSDYVTRLSDSLSEFLEPRLLLKSIQLNLFSSLRKSVHQKFKDPLLRSLLEFPVLFLGSTPAKTPALYSMMNYADLVKGTWFPMGGMGKIAEGFSHVAKSMGVQIIHDAEVTRLESEKGALKKVHSKKGVFEADVVVSGADYRHTEQVLLDTHDRVYDTRYWESRQMSPSALLYYVGLDREVPQILHHNLFFDEDFETHAQEIYEHPQWPVKPLFYLCASSKTDKSLAPQGGENLFFLIPLAPGLEDSDALREKYFEIMVNRLQEKCGLDIRPHIVVKRAYAMRDFEKDYHAYKGNAYGLANTLRQTAFLKPKIKSKKLKNLFYTGQLTVPGPGVPPAIISGRIVAQEVIRQIRLGKL